MNITEKLLSLSDLKYKEFQCKLMPTVDPETVIGVRTPKLRKFAKELTVQKETETFLKTLPHKYYEENNLHAFLIEQIADFDLCIEESEHFLPYVDNWATCDSMRPKCFKKNTDRLLICIERWLNSPHTYTVRFGIEMLMIFYLDEHFDPKYLKRVSKIKSDEYYVNMMMAWYFATALAKQWNSTVTFIEQNVLPVWVHNKTIQKAAESFRITEEQKTYLKSLKRKFRSS